MFRPNPQNSGPLNAKTSHSRTPPSGQATVPIGAAAVGPGVMVGGGDPSPGASGSALPAIEAAATHSTPLSAPVVVLDAAGLESGQGFGWVPGGVRRRICPGVTAVAFAGENLVSPMVQSRGVQAIKLVVDPPVQMHCDLGDRRRRSYAPQKDDLQIYAADGTWQWEAQGYLTGCVLLVSSQFLEGVAYEYTADAPVKLPGSIASADPFVSSSLGVLRRVLQESTHDASVLAESIATAVIVHLVRTQLPQPRLRQHGTGGLPPVTLRTALDYLMSNLETTPTLAEIARAVHMSPFHFARLFRVSTGQSPRQYLLRLRVERAKSLLRTQPTVSLTEIATRCGFFDQAHFCRYFRRFTGTTPAMFRRERAANA